MKWCTQRCRFASLLWVGLGVWRGGPFGRVQAQSPLFKPNSIESVSGQFIISTSGSSSTYELPLPRNDQEAAAIRLEPALLSVTAERIKQSIWLALGIPANTPWQGNIILALHAARQRDETTPISIQSGAKGCDYRVQLPDVLPKARFLRVMTSGVLFELTEHNAAAAKRTPELPAWLVDGFTQKLMTSEVKDVLVTAPKQLLNGLPQSRQESKVRGLDALADARQILRQSPPVSFAQMSWPDEDQLAGNDGGAYLASARVFVEALLNLPDGPARLNLFLTQLPQYENWQTAFQDVYQTDFPGPLDVEKWWSLQVVSFLSRDPGPAWTPEVSRWRFNEILTVPVEIRASSNSLPEHATMTFQKAILQLNYGQQEAIFNAKVGELGIAQLRLIPILARFASAYRHVLADYLGLKIETPLRTAGRSVSPRTSARETLEKLDFLDVQRQKVEANIKPDVWKPQLN